MRLHEGDCERDRLIYAPRDEDCYIRRASSELTIVVDRRLSQERRLLRKLEEGLGSSCVLDHKKQELYDKVRSQHKKAMGHIIADVCR